MSEEIPFTAINSRFLRIFEEYPDARELVFYGGSGSGKSTSVAQILLNGDRTAAGPTVPPGGLYMTQLWYDDGKAVFHVG